MRDPDEVQEAHDILWAFLAGEVENVKMDESTRLGLRAAIDTLCWVLEHDHVKTFPTNLQRLKNLVALRGGSFKKVN